MVISVVVWALVPRGAEQLAATETPAEAPMAIELSPIATTTSTAELSLIATFTPIAVELPPTSTPTTMSTPTHENITDLQGVTMYLVPAGTFIMGSNEGELDEQPVHEVYLDSYYIDAYEVTNKLYSICVATGTCVLPLDTKDGERTIYYGNPDFDNYPVIFVNWKMAKTYCEWRGARLPTEAEWEKAARGNDQRTYPWGEGIEKIFANYNTNPGGTTAVGSYPRGISPYGLYDMVGNVWEWVADWYSKTYYQSSPTSNPVGPSSGDIRVTRGGAWFTNESDARSANRSGQFPSNSVFSAIGFRCARPAP
jgi:formylglycine-generating enzyme required for sulfatase activity